MSTFPPDDRDLLTTSGSIAVANLNAQIDGLTAQVHRARTAQAETALAIGDGMAPLVDLLLLRGRVLGRIADYERAADLADAGVRDAPDDDAAWLARAKTQATFHRFPEALADLDAAAQRGADSPTLDAHRAACLQAVGCYNEALALRQAGAEQRPDLASLGALAMLHAGRGRVALADQLFAEARCRYQGVSPFPVAELDFRRGHMWLRHKRLTAACAWFNAAIRRLPVHAPAVGQLAETEAARGDHEAAIARLRPLLSSSDDPEYAADLARVLRDAGRHVEAARWRTVAAARYDELLARHPEAFTDAAGQFWLRMGGAPRRWRDLADQSRRHHETVQERALHAFLGRTA